jgi:transposase
MRRNTPSDGQRPGLDNFPREYGVPSIGATTRATTSAQRVSSANAARGLGSASQSPVSSAMATSRFRSRPEAVRPSSAIGANVSINCGQLWGIHCPHMPRAKIARMLDRLELLMAQITELEQSRDAVLENENPDRAAGMIQQLAKLRGLGVQSATVLVREGFVREFANGKALGSYAGLTATPYSSGGIEREQGIGKAGNARLRTVMVELAWIWQRYQPDSAQVRWFRERISGTGRRVRKVMVVALARKLLIALWRFATQGVVPEGAVMKPAS